MPVDPVQRVWNGCDQRWREHRRYTPCERLGKTDSIVAVMPGHDHDVTSLARMDERVKSLSDDLSEVKRTLYGNGDRGMKSSIVELRQAFRLLTWVGGIIAGALILDLSSRMIDGVDHSADVDISTPEVPMWKRDITNPRNDPRVAELRDLRRRVEEMAAGDG